MKVDSLAGLGAVKVPYFSFKTTSNEYISLLNTIGKEQSTHIENQELNFEPLFEYFMQKWSQKQKFIFHRLVISETKELHDFFQPFYFSYLCSHL